MAVGIVDEIHALTTRDNPYNNTGGSMRAMRTQVLRGYVTRILSSYRYPCMHFDPTLTVVSPTLTQHKQPPKPPTDDAAKLIDGKCHVCSKRVTQRLRLY